jgi:hypothetical protein
VVEECHRFLLFALRRSAFEFGADVRNDDQKTPNFGASDGLE